MASWQMQARSVECCCKVEKPHGKGSPMNQMCSMLSEYHGPVQELNLGLCDHDVGEAVLGSAVLAAS